MSSVAFFFTPTMISTRNLFYFYNYRCYYHECSSMIACTSSKSYQPCFLRLSGVLPAGESDHIKQSGTKCEVGRTFFFKNGRNSTTKNRSQGAKWTVSPRAKNGPLTKFKNWEGLISFFPILEFQTLICPAGSIYMNIKSSISFTVSCRTRASKPRQKLISNIFWGINDWSALNRSSATGEAKKFHHIEHLV